MKARISITALLVIVMASIAPATPAETGFPAKTIRIIAPVPPGSPPDVVARVIADQLSRDFGQPVIVENHPGANQTIGLGLVAAAPPDGHTLGMVSLPTAVVPNIVARMPFDTMRDLAPVREIAWTSNVLVVGSSSDIGSVRDLVAKAKAQPGRITLRRAGMAPRACHGRTVLRYRRYRYVARPFRGAMEGVAAV
jgi:tripartite-type tricarboxylate transporter receptor subunit TctC